MAKEEKNPLEKYTTDDLLAEIERRGKLEALAITKDMMDPAMVITELCRHKPTEPREYENWLKEATDRMSKFPVAKLTEIRAQMNKARQNQFGQIWELDKIIKELEQRPPATPKK